MDTELARAFLVTGSSGDKVAMTFALSLQGANAEQMIGKYLICWNVGKFC